MSENAQDKQTPQAAPEAEAEKPTNRPSFIAYHVNDGQDGKSYFNRVGAAFPHKDGQGHNILLDSVPVDGRVTLRTPQERLEDMRAEAKGEPQAQQQQEPER